MIEIKNEKINNWMELHEKYPNKVALVYNMEDTNDPLPPCILYAIGDRDDSVYSKMRAMLNRDIQNPGDTTFWNTSPADLLEPQNYTFLV